MLQFNASMIPQYFIWVKTSCFIFVFYMNDMKLIKPIGYEIHVNEIQYHLVASNQVTKILKFDMNWFKYFIS